VRCLAQIYISCALQGVAGQLIFLRPSLVSMNVVDYFSEAKLFPDVFFNGNAVKGGIDSTGQNRSFTIVSFDQLYVAGVNARDR